MTRDLAATRLEELRKQVKAEVRHSRAREAAATAKKRKRYRVRKPVAWQRIALQALKVAAIVALPFFVYVRASVLFDSRFGWPPWLAVAGAVVLVLALVAGYATWLARRVSDGGRLSAIARTIAVPMVAGWLGWSLLFLARVNAKTDDVQSLYQALHPVLRAAVSTAIILDREAVITDMQRAPQDYRRMGLPINPRTRHYVQSDGWVHAVDIRTNGRGEIRNRGLQLYFWAMGFSTLRHVGTADHLHVQLRSTATPRQR